MATESKSVTLEELRQQVEALGLDEKKRSKFLIDEWRRLKETEKEMHEERETSRGRRERERDFARPKRGRDFAKLKKGRGFAEPKLRKEGQRWN